ncbi:unnamed protein product [Amoebophrya sp. A120]|nr:unnamed protein product [Amoebophrya sp. A120]|eukprot:GSA120T00012174001.1
MVERSCRGTWARRAVLAAGGPSGAAQSVVALNLKHKDKLDLQDDVVAKKSSKDKAALMSTAGSSGEDVETETSKMTSSSSTSLKSTKSTRKKRTKTAGDGDDDEEDDDAAEAADADAEETTEGEDNEDHAASDEDVEAEECVCVNEGTVLMNEPDKFTAPKPDAEGQAWLNNTTGESAPSAYVDTPYGQNYTKVYGGPVDYGEYCRAWEDECTGGKAGLSTSCKVTNADTECPSGTSYDEDKDDKPDWCAAKWCYVKTKSAKNGEIASYTKLAGHHENGPKCSNIDDVARSSYGNLNVWYSYNYCATTATKTNTVVTVLDKSK